MAFNKDDYLAANPDVANALTTDPWWSGKTAEDHYNLYGKAENRPLSKALTATPAPAAPAGPTIQQTMGGLVNNPSLPPGTEMAPTAITANPNEFQTAPTIDPNATATQAHTGTAQTAAQVDPREAATVNPTLIGNNTPQMTAAQGQVSPNALVTAAQGTLSDETKAAFDATPQGTVDPNSLVSNQMAELTNFDSLSNAPAWARPSIRQAQEMLSKRGLGASSMAGEAVIAALQEAALPIAAANAKVFETMGLQNLDAKQKSALQKAVSLAQMDMKNLDNRQQAAVVNANAFLQMDLSNLNNEQQSRVINQQSRIQTLLSDQSAENAAKQFNAASENQVNQFYDGLKSSIEQFNTGQKNSMEQFNTGQLNSAEQFNSSLKNMREQFNVSNQVLVDQSNTKWRRDINTANTATTNAANQVNVQNRFNLSTTALNNVWQQMRDEADYAFTSSENSLNRSTNVAMMVLNGQQNMALMNAEQRDAFARLLGGTALDIFKGVITPSKTT